MKKTIIFGMLILVMGNSFAQKSKISCEKIKDEIIDEKIFSKMSNGQRIASFHLCKKNIYEIVIENRYSYYVCKPLMKKIKKAIKKNNCKDIRVQKSQPKPEIKIIRD